MDFLKKFDLERIIERLLEHVDLEEVTRDVLANLAIRGINLYFVVEKPYRGDDYEFLGLAYSEEAAKKLADYEDDEGDRAKIIRFDLGKLVNIVEDLGGTEEICR